jgi:hypothetical protein
MKKNLPINLIVLFLLIIPSVSKSQVINLGVAESYAIYTTGGAVTNSGTIYKTNVTGNIGTSSDPTLPGFGNIDGDLTSVANTTLNSQLNSAVLNAYNELNLTIPTLFPAPLLGNNQILYPGIYEVSGATVLNSILTLDAQSNPNAVFIFKINGAFSANAAAKIKLINGALACNVFWKVEGLISSANNTSLKGTFLANNAAIVMNPGDTLEGRLLSIQGAISVSELQAYLPSGCGSSILTGPTAPTLASATCFASFSSNGVNTNTGISTITGDVGTNGSTDLTTGYDALLVNGDIHPIPDVVTAQAAADLLIAYNYLVGLDPGEIELLRPDLFGHNLVLTPHVYLMLAAVTLTDTLYFDAKGNANAVFVVNVNGAFSTNVNARVILKNGAQAKNIYWKIDGAVSIAANSIFNGTFIVSGAISLSNGVHLNGNALTISGAINSQAVAIIVQSPCAPQLSNLVASYLTCLGDVSTLNVVSSNTVVSYQWQKAATNLVDGIAVSGAQTATLTINPTQLSDDATDYAVILTGAYGRVTTSQPITLIVGTAPVIATEPSNQTETIGDPASFIVVANGTNLTYQWRIGSTNLMNNGSISGTTSATLIINPTATLDAAPNYNVVVSGACPSAIFSVNASLTLTAVNLSVELLNFSTLCEENKQLIQWQTASEFNSAYFILEKSRDGIIWLNIKSVEAAGNSTQIVNYAFQDAITNAEEINYYRLKQVDLNGEYQFFGPISSTCDSGIELGIQIYPNPSKGSFMLEFTNRQDQQLLICVKDVMGHEVTTANVFIAAGVNLVPMTIAGMTTGIYFLTIETKDGSLVKKLTIE